MFTEAELERIEEQKKMFGLDDRHEVLKFMALTALQEQAKELIRKMKNEASDIGYVTQPVHIGPEDLWVAYDSSPARFLLGREKIDKLQRIDEYAFFQYGEKGMDQKEGWYLNCELLTAKIEEDKSKKKYFVSTALTSWGEHLVKCVKSMAKKEKIQGEFSLQLLGSEFHKLQMEKQYLENIENEKVIASPVIVYKLK